MRHRHDWALTWAQQDPWNVRPWVHWVRTCRGCGKRRSGEKDKPIGAFLAEFGPVVVI